MTWSRTTLTVYESDVVFIVAGYGRVLLQDEVFGDNLCVCLNDIDYSRNL